MFVFIDLCAEQFYYVKALLSTNCKQILSHSAIVALVKMILIRAVPGVFGLGFPLVFSQISKKRSAPTFWAHLSIHLFRTCENFRPSSLKVRSPDYVK